MPRMKSDTKPQKGPGRPPYFTSVEQIEGLVEQYFEDCKGTILYDDAGKMVFDKYGQPIILNKRPPTNTGLALALGFADRRTLYNYRCKKEFKEVLHRAMTRIEMYAEERLYDREGANGAKFALQNAFKDWNKGIEGLEGQSRAVVAAVKILNDIPKATQGDGTDG